MSGNSARYSLVSGEEDIEGNLALEKGSYGYSAIHGKQRSWKIPFLVSLFLNIIALGCWVSRNIPRHGNEHFPGIINDNASIYQAIVEWTEYSSKKGEDTAEMESLWDAMLPDHGIVVVDHEWARQKHLAPSRSLPSDDTKGVYLLEGYHDIHCLQTIRHGFYQFQKEHRTKLEPLYGPAKLAHFSHCFDALKQSLTCRASDFPLALTDRNGVVDGQIRRCRDWNALRDWASEHTTCGVGNDTLNMMGIPNNLCHGDNDGVKLAV